jgi:hypothetical protein
MYRILCPDGQWIAVSVNNDECNLLSLEGALKLAHRTARLANDCGKFLIFADGEASPVASTQLEAADEG